jgi:CDP-6-deoxy-D-xylo-4-hexulose-3-dehydrase
MDRLLSLKEEYEFILLEDACAATGSRYGGHHVGTFGLMSTFSLFFGHHLSTIEGGVICTDDEEVRDLLVQLRAHGWGKDLPPDKETRMAEEREVRDFNRPFTFYQPGFNVRSTDLNARIGLSQLEKVDHVVERRTENHSIYERRFTEAQHFHCQGNPDGTTCSISFAALADSPEHRTRVARTLAENNIETRPLGGGNMSRQPFWTDRRTPRPLPMADRIHETSFQLPNHPSLSTSDITFICDCVLDVTPDVD